MKKKIKLGDIAFNTVSLIVLAIIFLIFAYPFLYILSYSFSSPGQISMPLLIWPQGFTLEAYKAVLSDPSIWQALFISVTRSIIAPICAMIFSGMAAFALSRKELIAKRFFRLLVFMPMYFSAGVIPTYLLMRNLGLTNNYLAYIMPGLIAPFAMVLIRTYIESIPDSVLEAARIDGSSDFTAYWRIIFPICMPVNAAVALFEIIEHWNSFMATQLYNAMEPKLYTLQYVLYNTLQSRLSSSLEAAQDAADVVAAVSLNSQSLKMAITVITILPVMFVYPMLKKYFMSGIMVGSIKA